MGWRGRTLVRAGLVTYGSKRNDNRETDYFFRLFHAASDTFIFAEEKYRFSRTTLNGLADWTSLDAGQREAKLIDSANSGNATAKTIFNLMQSCAVYQFHNTSETARIRQRWNIDDNGEKWGLI